MPRVAALLDVGADLRRIEVVSPDTFVRPIYAGNALATVQSADKIKVVTVRATAFKAGAGGGAAPIEQIGGAGAKRPLVLRRRRAVQDRAAGADRGQDRRLGRPRHGERREFQDARGARRQARRRRGRQPRRGRRRLRAERLPGRPDRQDRGAGALHRRRHLRRDPASGRHEGQQGHRRHQQGRGGADLPGRRLRPGRRPVPDRAGADRRGRKESSSPRRIPS